MPDYQFVEGRESTFGIRIREWVFPIQREGNELNFRANIWDLAGQKENYNTHQFFLSKNSLYLFVWEARKGIEQANQFEYWLDVISLLSENSPIFVVQNKIDKNQGEISQKDWKEKYPHIIDFFKTSCATGEGIEHLRQKIQAQFLELPNTKELWNKDRFQVRETLENHEEEYMEVKEYLKICTENNLTKEQAFFLSQQLHDLGIILHFVKDPLLKNTVILKSEWAIDAAYCLVDTKKVENGRFQKKHLDTIWKQERFEYKHPFLLELMKKFELIFQFQESDTYIVPETLPIDKSEDVENFEPQNTDKKLSFEYHYDFMPKGILTRLICRVHHHIKDDWFWRFGVILEYEKETQSEIISNEVEKKIKIRLWGKNAATLLAIIRSNINYIHQTLKNPPLKEKIPCICEECKASKQPYLHDYQTLLKFQERRRTTRECAESANNVNIQALLEGILDTKGNSPELIDLIERGEIPAFYEKLNSIGVSGNEIARLQKEFVYDGGKFDYADKLKVWVYSRFGKN